jgi:aldehyde:ferredoxin oxidoreductase
MAEIRIKLLDVDLTNRKTRIIDVTEDVKKYLGGKGLGTKLLWDLVPKNADPLGPDNILHVGVGPVTGLMGTKTVISFKSPQTEWKGRSTMSGYFGREIMNAGYNAGILIRGKADTPVYLYVWNNDVQIRDASNLWGLWGQKTEYELRKALKEETGECFGVARIGPAGENMVRYACINTEWMHTAAKWGCGAVMGSKKLKAIAVRGTESPDYADHQRVWDIFQKYLAHPATRMQKYNWRRFGASGFPTMYPYGMEGVKNNQMGWHEVCMESNYVKHEMSSHIWTDGCPGCASPCFVPYFKPASKYDPVVGEMRHDNAGCFSANILVGFEEEAYITPLNNELGIDAEEAGGIVAWAMELYDRGIITKEDLGGIDLKWGNVEATCALLKKIAYRENLGNVLADGYRLAIPRIDKNAENMAFQVHGCGCATYDLRGLPEWGALSYASSHTGARMGTGIDSQISESATMCIFSTSRVIPEVWGSIEEGVRQYLNAVCGWNLTVEDIKTIALRDFMFERCFSLREGYLPSRDNKLPDRAFDLPITDKYGETYVLDRNWFTKALKDYYVETLQLTEDGLPPRALLTQLGLNFVIPVLKPMGVIG